MTDPSTKVFWWCFIVMYAFALWNCRVIFHKPSFEKTESITRAAIFTILGMIFELMWLLIYIGEG